MASKALIRDVVNQGLGHEFQNAEIARKNIADARNKIKAHLDKNPELWSKPNLGGILDTYLDEIDLKVASQVGIESALSRGINDGKTFVGDSARIPAESNFYGWTPSIPMGAISLAESEMADLIRKTTDQLKEKTLRAVQSGIAQGASIGQMQADILGLGIRGLKGKDGVFRSATARAEMQARTITNDLINRGALITYNEVGTLAPELGIKKIWQTVSDLRTSARCISLTGQIRGLKELFVADDGWSGANPPSHPNCRSRVTCTTAKYQKEWEDRWPQTGTTQINAVDLSKLADQIKPRMATTAKINPTVSKINPENVFAPDDNFTAEQWNNLIEDLGNQDPELGKRLSKIVDFQNNKKIQLVSHNGFDEDMIDLTKHLAKHTNSGSAYHVEMIVDLGTANGATMQGTNIVAVKVNKNLSPNYISAKDYKDHLKNQTYVKKAQQLEAYNKASKKDKEKMHFGLDWFVYDGKQDIQGSNQMLSTYIHEMGHQVQYKAMLKDATIEAAPFSRKELISTYGSDMKRESFAEGFVWYTLDPENMKAMSPGYYDWIDSAWKLAQ